MTTSVLIASYRRGLKLQTCLLSLDAQTQLPDEVIVTWQGDDVATRDAVQACKSQVKYDLKLVHLPVPGIVPAENAALDASSGQIILLLDDDAIAPPEWVARHAASYADAACGAVGGVYQNHYEDGSVRSRSIEPVGTISWLGRIYGNMYDHADTWRSRAPRRVQHLVGNNMSLRRAAFDRFEAELRPYWQFFELEVCLQVGGNGYDVWFDFSNVVQHYPTSGAFNPGRGGDLDLKVFNPAFNEAFVLSKFSPTYLRLVRLTYLFAVGSITNPGLVASLFAMRKYGSPRREIGILRKVWANRLLGWQAGARQRPAVGNRRRRLHESPMAATSTAL